VTTSFATGWTEGVAATMVSDSHEFAAHALSKLNAATTPAALRAMPTGIDLPCANGSLTVRMPRRFPRVLNIEWNGCQRYQFFPQLITGPGQIMLLTDDFSPNHVAGIRLGSDTRDLSIVHDEQYPEEFSHTVITRNVRMTGWIPMSWEYRPEGSDRAAYFVSGFRHEISDRIPTDPAQPPAHYEWRNELRNGLVMQLSQWANEQMYYDDEWRYVSGEYQSTSIEPYWGTNTTRWSVDNLRIRRVTDYANWSGNFSYDGDVSWTWHEAAPAGCTDGRVSLHTRSPFTIPSLDDSGIRDSGELVINGTATFRAYSSVTSPPGPPASDRLLTMDVQDVGSFHYDLSQFPDPIRIAANCL
jgi:hypothetical protein